MEFIDIYFSEMNEKLNEALELLKEYLKTHDPILIKDLYRIYHTLKGSAALVGLPKIGEFMHKLESAFKEKLNKELDEDFVARVIKISSEIINKKSDLTDDEIILFENILTGKEKIKSSDTKLVIEESSMEYLNEFYETALRIENFLLNNETTLAIKEVKKIRNYLQNLIEKNMFVPIKKIVKSFENLVIQESSFNNKKVKLNIEVENTKIEKKDTEILRDIMVHLVKNSIAHGIETPAERRKKGKDEIGNLTIKSYVKEGLIYIEISDDGKGLDLEKILEKAEKMNLGNIDPKEVIFLSGFSTKDTADQSSGRGIGLDSVKAFAEAKGGFVKLETEKDIGTKFIVAFKTKITSKKVLVLKRDENIFAVSSEDIIEVINNPEIINNKITYKNQLFDILDYGKGNIRFSVICNNNKAFICDEIIGHFEAFVDPYNLGEISGFAKNILSFPIPIISISKVSSNFASSKSSNKTILVLDDSVFTRFVVSNLIKKNGFKVIEAASGEEAIKKEGYDAAVVDVELPGISGYEVVKYIKNKNPDIPIIMLSTKSTREDIKKGLDSGANAYVVKGKETDKIIKLLKKFLN
ncbi:response regulator [Marinitoga arctica]